MNSYELMGISKKISSLASQCEEELKEIYEDLDKLGELNSAKVLKAFQDNEVVESTFNGTSGYGYNDVGRDKLEAIFANIFHTEAALVRNQFVSGSHALAKTLFALLRPNDLLLSISGLPYDTLHEVIGIKDNPSSLKSFGINYDQIDLVDNDFNYPKIKEYLKNNKVKVVEIQRSKGYSTRKSITIDKVKKVIETIREVNQEVIIMVDNCYCEFVSEVEPSEVGADIVVGSLIKNLGGGIAPNGAYVVGKKALIDLVGESLTLPGEGREVGPTLGITKSLMQGIFFAPSVVISSLKTSTFTALIMTKLGYKVEPLYNEKRADIVENIYLGNPEDLIKYCQGIQLGSPVDAKFLPVPWDMPGYDDQVIMASGAFTQGSSIELSCDAPLRSPYIAYQQGGLTYAYGKLGVLKAIDYLMSDKND